MLRATARKNPYISRGPVRDSAMFFGRAQPLQEIGGFLTGNQSVSVIGPSKIGKTSMLFELMRPETWPRLGLEPNNIFAYVDCQVLAQSAPETIFGQIVTELQAALQERGLLIEPRLEAQATLSARHSFEASLRQLNQRGLRLVLILDALENLSTNPHLDVSFFNALRSAAARFQLVFLTASTQPLNQLDFSNRSPDILSSPFFNIFAPLFLRLLAEDEARQLIREPSSRAGVNFTPEAAAFIYSFAGGHPYALQVACFHAFEYPDDRGEIEQRSMQELMPQFEYYWRNLTGLEQDTLRRASEAAGREAGDTTLRGALRDLVHKCLLVAVGGTYHYPSLAWETFVATQLPVAAVPSKRDAAHLTGIRLGVYELLGTVAHGGMAEVHRGRHTRLGRLVAIKILPASLAAEQGFRDRFEREARAVAALKHPNIIQVFDFGDSDGLYYMVMELITGQDLARYLAQTGPLPLPRASPVLHDIARALDYAHGQGLVHCDVKPSNVMLEKIEGGERQAAEAVSAADPEQFTLFRAILTDFGIVRILGGITGATQTATMGTLHYMAPEQIRASREIDGRTDVYALGVMTFQMLTGQLPFTGDNPGKVLMAHLQQPAPDPRQYMPGLPEGTALAILRAMAKDPRDRQGTAGELVEALT